MRMKVLRDGAFVPSKAHPDDAGHDLRVPCQVCVPPGEWRCLPLGVALELPPRTVGLVKDRSSLALRGLHVLGGVIDSGYRGEIKVVLVNFGTSWVTFNPGDRVAQLVVLSLAGGDRIHEADDLSPSDRGEGGFGSTGE